MWCRLPDGTLSSFDATWYFAPDGAGLLAPHHRYGSANWTRGIPYEDKVGEVLSAPRPWSNGATPPGLIGTNHCGGDYMVSPTLLETDEASNIFDQPDCCDAPNLCEKFFAASLAFEAPDGTVTPLRRLRISPTIFGLSPGFGGSQVGVMQRTGLTCHGSPMMRVVTVGPSPAFAIVEDWGLYAVDATFRDGHWYCPLSSPVFPGQTIEVLT